MKLYALYDFYSDFMDGTPTWYITDDKRLLKAKEKYDLGCTLSFFQLESSTLEDAVVEFKRDFSVYITDNTELRDKTLCKYEQLKYQIEFHTDDEFTKLSDKTLCIPNKSCASNEYKIVHNETFIRLIIPVVAKDFKERTEEVIRVFQDYSFINDTDQSITILAEIVNHVFSELTITVE